MLGYCKKMNQITRQWSGIVGGYPKAFFFLARRKVFGKSMTSARYHDVKFFFRYKDMSAIEETLLRGEYDFIVPALKSVESPVIIDVGMNVGDFAVMAVAHNPKCRIIGIEAHPETAMIAERNGQLNYKRKWTVLNRAAWKNNETIYLSSGEMSASSKISNQGNIAVKGIDMKSIWSILPEERVDVVKIDIEGAEEEFLSAAADYLDKVDHLIVEIHPLACDEAKVRSVLSAHFPYVEEVGGRVSSKPLLHCRRT